MSDDTKHEHLCTRAQGLALVRRSERERARWCLSVRLDAMIEGKTDSCFPDALAHYVELSRAQATTLISNLMGDTLEARGGRIRIYRTQGDHLPPVYWIGQ